MSTKTLISQPVTRIGALVVSRLKIPGSSGAGLVLTSDSEGIFRGEPLPIGAKTMMLCAGFTPDATGPDSAEFPVPYGDDGITAQTWDVKELILRVQTAGGSPSVTVQKSTGAGVFTPVDVGTVTIDPGAYEATISSSLGTVATGDKLRFNVVDIGTSENWTLLVVLAQ